MHERTTVFHKGNKLRSFTLEFKLDAINYAKTHSNWAPAKRFNVDESRSREWKQKEEKLGISRTKKGGLSKKRLVGGGRKRTDNELGEKVLNWIHERRENMLRVLRKRIMKKAKISYNESVEDDLCAKEAFGLSRGWLEKFMKRSCLSFSVDKQPQLKKIHLTL